MVAVVDTDMLAGGPLDIYGDVYVVVLYKGKAYFGFDVPEYYTLVNPPTLSGILHLTQL